MPPDIATPGLRPPPSASPPVEPRPRNLANEHAAAANVPLALGEPALAAPSQANLDPVDWVRLEARYGAHCGLMAKLARTAAHSLGPKPARLRVAWAAGELAVVVAVAHELRSALGSLLADTACALAKRVECSLREDGGAVPADGAAETRDRRVLGDWVEALACATEAVVASALARLPADPV